MNVIRTETLSPAWFERVWLTGEQKLVAALTEGLKRLPLFGVMLVLVMAAQWVWLVHLYSPRYPDHFAVKIWAATEFAFYLSLLFALAQLFRSSWQTAAVRSTVALFVFALTLIFCWVKASFAGSTDVVAGLVMTWLTIPLALLFLHARGLLGRAGLLLSLAIVFGVFPAVDSFYLHAGSVFTSPEWYLVWTDRLMIPFVVVLTEIWQQGPIHLAAVFNRETMSLFFHPTLFFYILPLSQQDLRHQVDFKIHFASAFLILIRVIAFKAMNMPLEKILFEFANTNAGFNLKTLGYGWLTYLDFFLFSYASLNLGIVVGRCLGLGLEEGTHFALLATTPLERWRRWNSYYYAWLFRFVFIPVFRAKRNWLLAIQIVFLATFFLHASRGVAIGGLAHFPHALTINLILQLAFFQAHGVAVYLSHFFPKWSQDPHSRASWVGVGTTHLMMAVVHILPLLGVMQTF
jgi:hypothetical protein